MRVNDLDNLIERLQTLRAAWGTTALKCIALARQAKATNRLEDRLRTHMKKARTAAAREINGSPENCYQTGCADGLEFVLAALEEELVRENER